MGGSACRTGNPFNTPFRSECVKIAVLITDDLPGGCFDDPFVPGVDDVNAHERALEAQAAGINISALFVDAAAGSDPWLIRPIMRDYAETTNGIYAELDANGTGIEDALADLFCSDCDLDGIPDECQLPLGIVRVYVDKDATGTPIDGTTWDNAFRDLQAATDRAIPCRATTFEIWVAEGTYKPTSQTSRAATFLLRDKVAMYGGFAGNETNREQRNPRANISILSGDIGTPGYVYDNSYHVVSAMGTDGTAVLDGFTITGGYADGDDDCGTGILCRGASPTIRSCVIRDNTVFSVNGGGAGIACLDEAAPTIANCLISANEAYYGAGIEVIRCTRAAPIIANCTIAGNSADWIGGGVDCYYSNDVVVTNCIIWGNAAVTGAQVSVSGESSATISHSDVQGLAAGVYFDGSSTLTWGSGNIGDNHNPAFVDVPTDYRLAAGSPCIDAGDSEAVPAGTTLDLDGYLRFADDPATTDCQWETGTCGTAPVVDMGAYEYASGPPDTDGDGVPDPWDLCPDTPSCATHLVDANGCVEGAYTDDDEDGVVDACDSCPDTPTCVATVDANGCPVGDNDNDGVWNGCDECDDTPACATVNAVGCPSDGDEDGVFDGCDQCPETMPSWRDYVSTDGCACNDPNQDIEPDGDVDLTDFGTFAACFNGPNRPFNYGSCYCNDDDGDGDVDLTDFSMFAACFNGPNRPHRCPGGASAPEGGGFAMSSLFGGESLLETVDVTFTLDSDQDQQTISAGTPVDWAAIVEVTGSNQGLASFVFDLELREGSATGPLAGVTLGTGVWADSFAVAGPDGKPETGAAVTASGSAGGPGMNALSSTGYNATPGLLQQIGAGYLTWDPWRLSGKSWTGNSTWGVGLDARKEALLLDAFGSYSLVTGTIDTTNLDPGDYVLRLVPAASPLVLESGIDLNSPAVGGVAEPAGSVSEPVTIEFTIGEE